MKKSLLNLSITALLAASSTAALAGSVGTLNTFVSGEKAVAADVNANFTAVATAVNGNATDITANTTAISSKANSADVYTKTEVDTAVNAKANSADVYTKTEVDTAVNAKANSADVYTKTEVDTAVNAKANSADVYTKTEVDTAVNAKANSADVYTKTEVDTAVNAKANSADVYTKTEVDTAIAASSGCPSDMVAAGSLCVDIYEASVYDAATAGTIIPGGTIPCLADGSDCTAGNANAIYARSVSGVEPAHSISLYQAAVACANVGKRLPTITEWQMAAAGTPAGNGSGASAECNNIVAGGGAKRNTSEPSSCMSTAGAYDMVGNYYELTADLHYNGPTGGATSTDSALVGVMGDDYLNTNHAPAGGPSSTKDIYLVSPADTGNSTVGFRCVK